MRKIIVAVLLSFPFGLFAQNQESKDNVIHLQARPEPLYVLDGKILGKVEVKKDSSQAIVSINNIVKPSEIESINVLKGDEAIKQYGDAGKNGVVIITTIAYSEKSKRH